MIRLHLHDALSAGVEVALTSGQAHYLTHVMRIQAGAQVLVFNGRDGEWRARLSTSGRRGATLLVEAQTRPQAFPPDLELVVALVKRARLETIVEKAAEMGVRRVRLVTTRRTNADRTRVERLVAIATEAAEQTGRLDAPAIEEPQPLASLLDAWPAERRLMFCDEAGDGPEGGAAAPWGGVEGRAAPALEVLGTRAPGAPWAVLIGPEGGFDPEERARLRGLPFVTAATLGPRILRADTAAIAALTLWQTALGDWRSDVRDPGPSTQG